MKEGWICARCKASVAPDETTCPVCSVAQQLVVVPSIWPTGWPYRGGTGDPMPRPNVTVWSDLPIYYDL